MRPAASRKKRPQKLSDWSSFSAITQQIILLLGLVPIILAPVGMISTFVILLPSPVWAKHENCDCIGEEVAGKSAGKEAGPQGVGFGVWRCLLSSVTAFSVNLRQPSNLGALLGRRQWEQLVDLLAAGLTAPLLAQVFE